eukprot:PITA_08167
MKTNSSLVCWLKKSLYGLKEAPQAWYAKMDRFLLDTRFSKCHSDNTIYTKKVVLQSKEGISLSQSKYTCDLLFHFHKEDCNLAPSPFQSRAKFLVTCTSPEVDATLYYQLVGNILYLTHTRPYLSFVVGLISRFMQSPHESHWKLAKRIIHCVRGIVQFGIHYSAEASPLLVGFTDSNWVGDLDDRKSTAAYVFTLVSRPITWACKKKSVISLCSVEAEYLGTMEASKEALWLRHILSEFGFQQQHPTTLWCDNQSAIQLCKDPVQHQHRKHMHFIRKLIHDHVLEVKYCSTDDRVVDIFTKALTEVKFTKLRFMVGF